jgi:hypothetical protein
VNLICSISSLVLLLPVLQLTISTNISLATSDVSNTSSNVTANVTAQLINRADNVLKLASESSSNATQEAMEKTMSMLSAVNTSSMTDSKSNEAQSLIDEAQSLIDAASNASNITTKMDPSKATDTTTATSSNFKNYNSNLYKIQFQYPSTWTLNEKTSRFDEGSDISISSSGTTGYISVQYLNSSTLMGMDVRSLLYEFFKSSIDGDYTREYKIIEQPSFTTVGNQTAGTYLYTDQDKYEDYALRWATQNWIVRVEDHGYLISFYTTTDLFDSTEIKNIREQFLKSIKFAGSTNQITNPTPNRFD